MLSTVEDQIQNAVLLDPTETLKYLLVDDLLDDFMETVARKCDVTMDGVAENIGAAQHERTLPALDECSR